MKINKDQTAASTLGLFFIFGILVIIAAFVYFVIATISDAGGLSQALKDIGEDSGAGLWGFLSGATVAFTKGAWNSGTTLGAKTQKYNIFNNGRKIWRNYFG